MFHFFVLILAFLILASFIHILSLLIFPNLFKFYFPFFIFYCFQFQVFLFRDRYFQFALLMFNFRFLFLLSLSFFILFLRVSFPLITKGDLILLDLVFLHFLITTRDHSLIPFSFDTHLDSSLLKILHFHCPLLKFSSHLQTYRSHNLDLGLAPYTFF